MRVLIVFACFVAMAAAECGPLERLKVKHQWATIYSKDAEREHFAREFWQEFFFEDPSARALFSRVHSDNIWSPEFQAHGLRVLGGLDMVISMLTDQPLLEAELHHLHDFHDHMEITDEHWRLFKRSLAIVISHHDNTEHFDVQAWKDCAQIIGDGIRDDYE